ncbi:MAG: phosphoribosylamine--glycine ligase, partial [Candidatus Bathyarchaeota archaeon]
RGGEVSIAEPRKSELFFASVHEEEGVIRTTGSRAIALLAKGGSVREAREKVYQDVPNIRGELFYRRDIGEGV